MNKKIFTTLTLLAATALLPACSMEALGNWSAYNNACNESMGGTRLSCDQYNREWNKYRQDLATWEDCVQRNANSSPGSYFCPVEPRRPY